MNQRPVDRIIRELVESGRLATRQEITEIIDHIAVSPFNTQDIVVDSDEQGISYQGITLGARVSSPSYHIVKRVVIEKQWADGVTTDQYLEDLRRAVRDPIARLAVYRRRGGYLTATITPANRVMPAARRGEQSEADLLVVYSADRGKIVTGYQFSDIGGIGIPSGARWLK